MASFTSFDVVGLVYGYSLYRIVFFLMVCLSSWLSIST